MLKIPIITLCAIAALVVSIVTGCASGPEMSGLRQMAQEYKAEAADCSKSMQELNRSFATLTQSNARLAGEVQELGRHGREYSMRIKECEFTLRERDDECRDDTRELGEDNEMLRDRLREAASCIDDMADLAGRAWLMSEDLGVVLADYTGSGRLSVLAEGPLLYVTVDNKLLFNASQPVLSGPGKRLLEIVAGSVLRIGGSRVDVRAYSDNIPPSGELAELYPGNWELTSARAASVAAYLVSGGGLEPSMLSATGYADNSPMADNSTAVGRAMNRRVVLAITPAMQQEEASEAEDIINSSAAGADDIAGEEIINTLVPEPEEMATGGIMNSVAPYVIEAIDADMQNSPVDEHGGPVDEDSGMVNTGDFEEE